MNGEGPFKELLLILRVAWLLILRVAMRTGKSGSSSADEAMDRRERAAWMSGSAAAAMDSSPASASASAQMRSPGILDVSRCG